MRYFLIIIYAVFTLFPSSVRADIAEDYMRGLYYESEGEYKSAYKMYQKILNQDSILKVHIKVALMEFYMGNTQAAYNKLKSTAEFFSNEPSIYSYLGDFAYEQSLYAENAEKKNELLKESKAALTKALELEPSEENFLVLVHVLIELKEYYLAIAMMDLLIEQNDSPSYYGKRGEVKLYAGDSEGGLKDLKTAASQDDVFSLALLGEISLKEGNEEKALQYLHKLYDIRPDIPSSVLYLGDFYYGKQDYPNSLRYYMEALPVSGPELQPILLERAGESAYRSGDFELALELYLDLLQINENDSRIFYIAGSIAAAYNKPETESIYIRGLELYPDFAMLRKDLGIYYTSKKEYQNALNILEPVDPLEKDVEYYLVKANAYEGLKKTNQALATLKEGLAENPVNINLILSAASLYFDMGEKDMCIAMLKEAYTIEPESSIVQNFLGYIYADLNINLEEAESLIDKALAQDPGNYAYLDSKAWVLYRKGNIKEAADFISKAYAINPNEPEIKEHYQEIMSAAGR